MVIRWRRTRGWGHGRKRGDLVRLGEAPAQPPGLPEGIVTFLLTDIEGSTPLWERHRAAMGTALARHEALVAGAVAAHAGLLIKSRGEGDSTLSVFVRATDAVAAALAIQQALASERWPDGMTLPTRVALHSGEAGLAAAGFTGVSVTFTHQVGDGLHAAIVKATKPATATEPTTRRQLPVVQESGCC
jgi:class 3 adenylate cyclase